MCPQILIAQMEPVGSTEFYSIIDDVPRFIDPAPTCFWICQPSQCVTNRIQVGTDIQTIMFKVIAGIDNDREIFRREDLGKSVGKLGATDSTCKGYNFQFLLLQPPSTFGSPRRRRF